MDDLFENKVHLKVTKDKRTTHTGNLNPLGYPYGFIQNNVLGNGRADFSNGYKHEVYGNLSADDKVLLYCYFNMRGHFHSSTANFEVAKDWLLETLFAKKPLIIDFGCGPATTALAIADLFPDADALHDAGHLPGL